MPPDPTEPLPMVPPAMVDDLQALSATPPVPARVDRLVLLNAERHFAQTALRRRNRFRIQRFAAAAAGIAMFVLAGTLISRRTSSKPGEARLAADFDGNGVVNILDAHALARQIDASRPLPALWDLNTDGKVDRADVDTIAMRSVRLGGAG